MPLTKKTDEFTVKEDTEKFLRHVNLKAHFHDKELLSDEPQTRIRIAQTEEVKGLVHTMPDKFENATLRAKTEQMFCVHTRAF